MNFNKHVSNFKGLSDRKATLQLHRSLLEKDVQRLKSRLNYEIDLRRALESALGYGDESVEDSKQNLSAETLKALSDVTLLETAVSKLENEVIHLRHHVGCARSERQILVTQSQREEDGRSDLASKVEELKTKVSDIEAEVNSEDKSKSQSHTSEKVEHTFLGLPLGLKKHPDQAVGRRNQKDHSLQIPKRASFDDSNLNSSSRSKLKQETQASSVKSKALFSGKLYSSVDVPNIAQLLKSQSKFSANRILKTIVSPAQKRREVPPSTRKK